MKRNTAGTKFIPGTYVKTRPDAAELANRYIREWDEKRIETKGEKQVPRCPPTICLSRKTGGGALEIAEILAKMFDYPVVDRTILEYIAGQAKLSQKTVEIFDERYPGKLGELLSMAFGEKAFIKSDYTRHFFSAVYTIAGLGPTIFVGRGVHLLLPRERVLAVRIICSRECRIRRLSSVLGLEPEEAGVKLDQLDGEQKAFFREVYGRKDASAYEFDLVINCDHIREPDRAAAIVERAFTEKFGEEVSPASRIP